MAVTPRLEFESISDLSQWYHQTLDGIGKLAVTGLTSNDFHRAMENASELTITVSALNRHYERVHELLSGDKPSDMVDPATAFLDYI